MPFSNNGKVVSPRQVAKARATKQARTNFYMTDELLKEHPLKPAKGAK